MITPTATRFAQVVIAACALLASACHGENTTAEVLASATPTDYQTPAGENLLVMRLDHGEVLIELAPSFAPNHVANIRQLVRQRYFDDTRVLRSQDNYVVQWGDAEADTPKARSLGQVEPTLAGEYFRDLKGLDISPLKEDDAYAPQIGFAEGFPVGYDRRSKTAWLAHCYGMVGVGRGNQADSGNGSSLYVVTGHAPRHLDRNVTLVGRVLLGIEHLSALPRGTGPLGFYATKEEMTAVRQIQLASDMPENERPQIHTVRTDTPYFKRWVDARRFRVEDWFIDPVGAIGLCNVPLLPVAELPTTGN